MHLSLLLSVYLVDSISFQTRVAPLIKILRFDCLERLYQGSPFPMAGVLLFPHIFCFSSMISHFSYLVSGRICPLSYISW